jgi:hypothetical protein
MKSVRLPRHVPLKTVIIYLSIYTALVGLGRVFGFLIYTRYDSLDGGSARRKATTYSQNITKTQ